MSVPAPPEKTCEEAMALALDWAEGRRSYINSFMEVETGFEDRVQTLAAVAMADAQEVVKWSALAVALAELEQIKHAGGTPWEGF